MTAYYNEFDKNAAQWLRNLIDAGHIASGVVDDRSIEDVRPSDLAGFTQCHFFAGIGVWSHALRRAGWDDSRPVWTGSCPCQPFSAAGQGAGFDDERHLWPAFHHLIAQCKPAKVLGEQVASRDADPWIDLVQDDLEAMGYAFGAVPFPSAGVGAPHIRDRLYWVAHTNDARLEGRCTVRERADQCTARANGVAGGVADAGHNNDAGEAAAPNHGQPQAIRSADQPGGCGASLGRLADAAECGRREERADAERIAFGDRAQGLTAGLVHGGSNSGAGPTNGLWRDADWLACRDGKWRPVEPGYEQMVDGSASSLGRVRSEAIAKIEEEINDWSIRHQTYGPEGLRALWHDLSTQALCEREIGRFSGVRAPAVLLAFLRQLTEQGWRFADALACTGSGSSEIVMRILRFDRSAACAPLRRELAEQLTGQPADPLRELSSIVAHHAGECWGQACRQKTGAASFPLTSDATSRVVRLRAYGNAICAPAAQAFIDAVVKII